jgi:SAM-dependent methyltransferase
MGEADRAVDLLTRAEHACSEPFWATLFLARALQAAGRPRDGIAALSRAADRAGREWSFLHRTFQELAAVVENTCDREIRSSALAVMSTLFTSAYATQRESTIDAVSAHISLLGQQVGHQIDEVRRFALDGLSLLHSLNGPLPKPFQLQTAFPIASDSNDHRFPRGTMWDNTRHPRFVFRCEELFPNGLSALDLGCAGGGLVYDFVARGHRALGLEGSDYSLRHQRAAWRLLPYHLKTCDITKPFTIIDSGDQAFFNVISAWEVLEHIPESNVAQLLANIRRHLAPDGLLVASVAQFDDFDPETGISWHPTIRDKEWWTAQFSNAGLVETDTPFADEDYVRGSGNPTVPDWDHRRAPHLGFHIIARTQPN